MFVHLAETVLNQNFSGKGTVSTYLLKLETAQ